MGGRGGYWQLGRGGGGLRATHYYHMHTSRGVCVWGAWGKNRGRATCCTPRHGRLREGGGGGGSLRHSLQRSLSWAPERRLDPCLGSLGRRSPPPFPGVHAPDVRVSAAPRLRSCAEGGGCPTCPRAQQCRTPLPTAAHVAHCLCRCAEQILSGGHGGIEVCMR